MLFITLSIRISSIMLREFRWYHSDFNNPYVHYLKRQRAALIIDNNVDQGAVVKIMILLLISFILDIFNIIFVSNKSCKYQQNPSLTFRDINMSRIRLSNLILFCRCRVYSITFHKTLIAQKLYDRSISYCKFQIQVNWNLTYQKTNVFIKKYFWAIRR